MKVYIITDLEGCPVRVYSTEEKAKDYLVRTIVDPRYRERFYDISEYELDDVD